MKKIVLDCQSLWDIALQELGDISGILELAEKQEISLTDELKIGQELEIPPELKNKQLAGYYLQHDIRPATGLTIETMSGDGALILEGIDFWGIEYDFIVI